MTSASDTNRTRRRSVLRILLWVLVSVIAILLAIGGWGTWSVLRAFPTTEGELEAPGLAAEVKVQRDARGIPTITADSSDDLFFAQGFVHAQDRFWEMDFRRHVTSGRLSELFGESQVGTDTFLRSLGWHEIAKQEVEMLPEEVRGYYEAYAAGVNAYLEERHGGGLGLSYTVLALQNPGYEPEPWTPADSVAWLKAMAWDLRTNIEEETSRSLQLQAGVSPEQLADLYPAYPFGEHPVILAADPSGKGVAGDGEAVDPFRDPPDPTEPIEDAEPTVAGTEGAANAPGSRSDPQPDAFALADAMIGSQGEGIGSNSWVVSGAHTESGLPLLANDPHLGAELPSVWTQMQLKCSTVSEKCPFQVAGYSFSGLPGIVIGHNTDIAWGFTNLTTDVADLYVERVDDDGYWQDGERRPFQTREETIEVAGGDEVRIEVRSTGHGPIVSGLSSDFTAIAEDPGFDAEDLPGDEFAVSLRWTALDAGSTAEAIFLLNTADDFAGFREAASRFDVPAQNLVYADIRGNIGYQAPGSLPVRGEGDGSLPQPGWDSAYDWRGTIPFDRLPRAYNPASGWIVTANNAIVDDGYPYPLSLDWDYGYRAARIEELLAERIEAGPVTAADMTAIQMDNRSPMAESLRAAYAGISAGDDDVAAALELLAEWDGQNDAGSAAAAYANVLWEHVTLAMADSANPEIARDDQSRFARFFELQLEEPGSEWFGEDREALLLGAASEAYKELVGLQGSDPAEWNWGELHALPLVDGSFGESGIRPIEALFNRGPYPVGGGSGVVNATGSTLGEGYATVTVPSMRMVVDLADWDGSTWQNLTGQSGHPFNAHYADQVEGWASGEPYPWSFTARAVYANTDRVLTLLPG